MSLTFRALGLAGALVCLTIAGRAQSTNSSDLRGTVTDSTGAVVPAVKVSIQNIETGVTTELVTNDAGIYDSVSIRPGRYRVTFSKEGFEKLVRDGITLDVGVLSVDAQLTVGTSQQQITVAAEAPLLKTDTGEQSATMRTEVMTQLPNIGQDWENFEKVLPGFQNANNANNALSINGTMPNYYNIMADGGSVLLPHSDNFDVAIFETVQEVQIETSTFSAQYGIGGAVFNQISKGGTNGFHGAAYEYLQNNFFNARNTFSPAVNLSRWDNFGGSIGGPIRKNKMFFYFNVDKIINNGGSYPFSSFPTALARAGDFSDTGSNKSTSYQNLIYDPQTTVSTGPNTFTRSPFPGNMIPQSRFSPVAIAAEQFWPMPNLGVANQVANNYQTFVPSVNPFLKFFGRMDYNVSDANRITFSITERDNPGVDYSSNCPSNCQAFDIDSRNVQLSDVWTIKPTVVNEFRMAYTRQGNWFTPVSYGEGYPAKLGIHYAVADVLPTLSVSGPVGGTSIGPGTNAIYAEDSLQPSDVVTLIKGRHILHFGGELLDFRDNSTPWGNINAATLTFSGAFTRSAYNVTTSGLGYADFLLGAVASWSGTYTPIVGGRQKDPQVFAQDDFKVLPNLTLNFGLRYEYQAGWHEVANRFGGFDPTIQNPLSGNLGAMWFGQSSSRNSLMNGVNTWLPRVGFAWSPFSKWSVRGGFGIYSLPWSIDTYSGGEMGFGTLNSGSITNTDQTTPLFYAQNPNPPVFVQNGCVPGTGCYVLASHDPGGYNGQSVNFIPRHIPVGKNYEWNFSIQRELASNIVVEAAYVGNHGTGLPYPVNINQVPQQSLGLLPVQNYRPYPQYSAINGNYFDAHSNYDALQLSFHKRFARGFSFETNYVWSKFLSNYDSSGWGSRNGTNTIQNSFARNSTYSLSNFDVPQNWKGAVVYTLPFGKGQPLLNRGGIANMFLGGWQVSSLFLYQSGNVFTVSMNSNSTNSQANSQYPNVVPGVPLYPANKTAAEWFNPAAFVSPGQYTFGDAGRNILRGPRYSDVDFSAAKVLPLTERARLQFRFDATNALNHTSLGIPNTSIGGSTVGQITGAQLSGRTLQLGARLSF
ncbi:MAG TPA: TonB-dependent receptor [Bryobacteraceae bacterium]|nr:TonB-dependent receptor [Bryobacteraceae bacterium]